MESKNQVLKELNSIDNLIQIYSTIDMVRVEQLMVNKVALESILLNIMSEENDIHLATLKALNG